MSTPALDALIAQIVATAAKEIAAAIRAHAASPPAPRPAAPQKPAAAEPAKPAASKPHPRRSYTDADIDGVLALITSKPGLRSEEIKAAIGGDDRAVEKILERLRATGRVKTLGVKRAMTYTVVSSGTGAPPQATPKTKTKASRTARKPRKAKTAVAAAGASLAATAKAPSTNIAGATVAFGGNPFGTDHVQMRNGSEYNGTLLDRSLQFAVEGSDDTIAIDTAQLVRLSINFVGDGKDQVLLRDGSESLGKVKTSALKFKTDTMGTLTLKVGQMLALQRLGNL